MGGNGLRDNLGLVTIRASATKTTLELLGPFSAVPLLQVQALSSLFLAHLIHPTGLSSEAVSVTQPRQSGRQGLASSAPDLCKICGKAKIPQDRSGDNSVASAFTDQDVLSLIALSPPI